MLSNSNLGSPRSSDLAMLFITHLPKLEVLHIRRAGLKGHFPPPHAWVSGDCLREIHAAENEFKSFCAKAPGNARACQYWPRINRLSLKNNDLKEIDESVGELVTLSYLDFSGNADIFKSSKIPPGLRNLKNLMTFSTAGMSLPDQLCGASWTDLNHFLEEETDSKAEQWRSVRMIALSTPGSNELTQGLFRELSTSIDREHATVEQHPNADKMDREHQSGWPHIVEHHHVLVNLRKKGSSKVPDVTSYGTRKSSQPDTTSLEVDIWQVVGEKVRQTLLACGRGPVA